MEAKNKEVELEESISKKRGFEQQKVKEFEQQKAKEEDFLEDLINIEDQTSACILKVSSQREIKRN